MLGGLGGVGAARWREGVLGVGVDGPRVGRREHGLHGVVPLVRVAVVTESTGGPGTCIGQNRL